MELGMVGLGRMGGNMAERVAQAGHRVVAYDRDPDARRGAEALGRDVAASLEELAQKLTPPRAVWTMVPSGAPTEATVTALADVLSAESASASSSDATYYRSKNKRLILGRVGKRRLACALRTPPPQYALTGSKTT